MKNFGKIVGVNLLILLIYSVMCKVFGDIPRPEKYNPLFVYIAPGVVWMAVIIVFHAVICLFVGAYSKDVKQFKSFLLTALLILLIGFGTCVSTF
jgi:hypothetical protein